MSPSSSAPCQPTSSQNDAGRGSVTIIELFIGSHCLRRPRSRAVKPSVARITWPAVTVPYGVRARCGAMAVTGVRS